MHDKTLIMGAGPSGLACAYTLSKAGKPCMIIEKDDTVGGLCRTLNFNGYLFDIGGHRFLSASKEINELWQNIMGNDMLHVNRLSRIYYRKRFFIYPLSFFNTFRNLGLFESILCVLDYIRCCLLKPGDNATFEGWVINRFGKRLYNIFFKTYTEKVWSVACRDISADWAKERIQGLSLQIAIKKAIFGTNRNMPKTLTDEFLYPRTGPGEFYNRLKQLIEPLGAHVLCNRTLVGIRHDGKRVISVEIEDAQKRTRQTLAVDHIFSSIPLPFFVKMFNARPPEPVVSAANKLRFRGILIVNIILDRPEIFPDQWLYIHSPEVMLGRIQNYKNWSHAMTPDLTKTSLGLEYFCTEGDRLWGMNNVDLINFALGELEKLGISSRKYLINGFVVRRPDVYPIYSLDYKQNLETIKKYLGQFINVTCMGRGGLFRYDNSDRAILSGIYAAKSLLSR